MYQLRHDCDGVLVGIGAVLADNPKLTVKEKYVKNPRQPVRIVLDTYCQTPENALIVNKDASTFIITGEHQRCEKQFQQNVEVIPCATTNEGFIDLHHLLPLLYRRGIKTLMVEGGGTVIWSFIKEKLVDDLFIYVGSMIIGGKTTPTMVDGNGFETEKEIPSLKIKDVKRLGDGVLLHYVIKN